MKVELKKIKYFAAGSQETNCFTCEVWIDGKLAGSAENNGHGGMTNIHSYNANGRVLIHNAEGYFNSLPEEPLFMDYEKTKPFIVDGKQLHGKQTLDGKVDELIDQYLQEKELARFNKKLAKDMLNAVCVGIANKEYKRYQFKIPIAGFVGNPVREAALIKSIKELRFNGHINGKDKNILNTNIPEQIINKSY